MIVHAGGKTYDIYGITVGDVPAWKLIRVDGQPLTAEYFASLCAEDQTVLIDGVKAHLAELCKTAQRSLSKQADAVEDDKAA